MDRIGCLRKHVSSARDLMASSELCREHQPLVVNSSSQVWMKQSRRDGAANLTARETGKRLPSRLATWTALDRGLSCSNSPRTIDCKLCGRGRNDIVALPPADHHHKWEVGLLSNKVIAFADMGHPTRIGERRRLNYQHGRAEPRRARTRMVTFSSAHAGM